MRVSDASERRPEWATPALGAWPSEGVASALLWLFLVGGFASCTFDVVVGDGREGVDLVVADATVGLDAGGPDTFPPGCALAADGGPVTCYVLNPIHGSAHLLLYSVDMVSAETNEVMRWTSATEEDGFGAPTGMAYDGTQLVVAAQSSWYSLDPKTASILWLGTTQYSPGVGWTGRDWIAHRGEAPGDLARYTTVGDLGANVPSTSLSGIQYDRFTITGDCLYGTTATPDHIEMVSLQTGAKSSTARFEFPGWLHGLSVVGRTIYLLRGFSGGELAIIFSFDLDTGAFVAHAKVPGREIGGLYCTSSAL